jgi:hypothetical protein
MPPFALEMFLRDEAGVKPENVAKYLPLLQKNEVDEKSLPLLSDANLEKMGVLAVMDRSKIFEAAKRRSTGTDLSVVVAIVCLSFLAVSFSLLALQEQKKKSK